MRWQEARVRGPRSPDVMHHVEELVLVEGAGEAGRLAKRGDEELQRHQSPSRAELCISNTNRSLPLFYSNLQVATEGTGRPGFCHQEEEGVRAETIPEHNTPRTIESRRPSILTAWRSASSPTPTWCQRTSKYVPISGREQVASGSP